MTNLLFIATIVNNMYISWDQVWCLCNQHNHHQNDDNHHQYDDKKHQHDGNVLKINFHNSFASASWIYHQHEEITTPPSLPIPSPPSPSVSSLNLRILTSPFGQKSPVWKYSGNIIKHQGMCMNIGEFWCLRSVKSHQSEQENTVLSGNIRKYQETIGNIREYH